jgi:NDP-hexose 2,3-enoyl reductase
MNFGRYATQDESFAIMNSAHELGINYFDTANSYGSSENPHHSEEIIGTWFSGDTTRRERTVLATKLFEGDPSWPNRSGLSALNIVRTAEASLRRLRTDYIDILQMHHVDRAAPWEEVWEAFETLRAQGKILYAGSSNFAGWHLMQAQHMADERHFFGLVSEQSVYSLLERTIELEVLPAAEHLGIGVVAWSPLAGGLLSRPRDAVGQGSRLADQPQDRAAGFAAPLERYFAFARERGLDPSQLALAWVVQRPGIAAAISGPRTAAQLVSSAAAADVELTQADLDELDSIWPGPGGAAPEAYAW